MLCAFLLVVLSSVYSTSVPGSREISRRSTNYDNNNLISQSRQQSPVASALTGLFSPPFIILVGMGALAHTVERFFTDVIKSSSQGLRRRRKKKKPQSQEPIKPFPPLQFGGLPPAPPQQAPPPPQQASPPEPAETAGSAEPAPTRHRWRYRRDLTPGHAY